MIKAILWDFGGVFTTSPFEAFARFERAHGLPKDFIRTINSTNPDTNAWAQFESSAIDVDGFNTAFRAEAEALGHSVQGKDVLELLSGEFRPRMVAALSTCKEHYKVACITNNMKKAGEGPAMAATDERAQTAATVMAQFDIVVESSLEGVRKPNPRNLPDRLRPLGRTPGRVRVPGRPRHQPQARPGDGDDDDQGGRRRSGFEGSWCRDRIDVRLSTRIQKAIISSRNDAASPGRLPMRAPRRP